MTYACSYEVPAPVEMYREVRRLIGVDAPEGMITHLVIQAEGVLRHIEVWDSEEAWTRFHEERVEPAVHQVLRGAGFIEMPPDPPLTELDLVDVWLGAQR
jgi:hypothetical protein